MAESRFFPLAMLRLDAEPLGPRAATTQGDKKQLDHMPLSVWSSNRCAGAIRGLEHAISEAFERSLAA